MWSGLSDKSGKKQVERNMFWEQESAQVGGKKAFKSMPEGLVRPLSTGTFKSREQGL